MFKNIIIALLITAVSATSNKQVNFTCPKSDFGHTGCVNPNSCLYPYPGNSSKYIRCEISTNGKTASPITIDCPPGLFFNLQINSCDFPGNSGFRINQIQYNNLAHLEWRVSELARGNYINNDEQLEWSLTIKDVEYTFNRVDQMINKLGQNGNKQLNSDLKDTLKFITSAKELFSNLNCETILGDVVIKFFRVLLKNLEIFVRHNLDVSNGDVKDPLLKNNILESIDANIRKAHKMFDNNLDNSNSEDIIRINNEVLVKSEELLTTNSISRHIFEGFRRLSRRIISYVSYKYSQLKKLQAHY